MTFSRLLAASAVLLGLLGPAAGVAQTPAPPAAGASRDEEALASGKLSVLEQRHALRRLAEGSVRQHDYNAAVGFAQRYLGLAGADPEMRDLLTVALYRSGRHEAAARALQAEIYTAERSGQAPSEERLQWLLDCYDHINDRIGAIWVLERLVIHYPRRNYWGELLTRSERREVIGGRLILDLWRLRLATGSMAAASDYVQMINLTLQAGLPAEARRIVETGFASGVLGNGPDAARHRALREQIARRVDDDRLRLAQPEVEARARADADGAALADLGFAHVTHGHQARGIALMEAGIRKGVVAIPQDAKLRLAIAHFNAGQRAKALEVLRTVGGRHGAGDLARMWEWFVLRPELLPPLAAR